MVTRTVLPFGLNISLEVFKPIIAVCFSSFFDFKILVLDLLDCISMMTEVCEHQMLDEKIDYFVYMLYLCKDLSVSCFLTFIGRPNAIQIYTKSKYNMKSCKILSIKLPFFFFFFTTLKPPHSF